MSVSFIAKACQTNPSGTTYAWSATVKQSNDFNGPNNDFKLAPGVTAASMMVTGSCVGPAAHITFTTPPSDTKANATMANVVVKVTDAQGNAVVNDSVSLTSAGLATNPSAAATTNGLGQATLSVQVRQVAGSYSMTASDATISSASASFKILPGDPAALTFTAQPTDTVKGNPINGSTGGVQVSVVDIYSNAVADGTGVVVSIGTDPTGGATLTGTKTRRRAVASRRSRTYDPSNELRLRLHAVSGAAAGNSATFAITNTDSSCTAGNCTATFPSGGTVSAPAGTTLIIETNQLNCDSVIAIAGTATIVPEQQRSDPDHLR